MSDFTSAIWGWFIAIVVIVSFVMIIWLIRWTSRGATPKTPSGEAQTMGHVWDENLEELNNPLPRWWLYMFYITIVFGAGYLLLYPGLGSFKGLLGWTEKSQYENELQQAEKTYGPIFEKHRNTSIPALVDDPEAMRVGEKLFSTYCTVCHGSDARGVRGFPNLRDNDWLYGGSPEKIEETILNGRSGAMPAWGEMLGKDGVFNVAEYVLSLSGREVDNVVASRGKQIFEQNCAICHGPDGKGNQMIGAPNLTDNIWLYGGTQKQVIKTITYGRNGHMPAHKEFLGEAKVHLLAAYIYSLSVNENADED